jgi:hypothetical protein
VRFVEAAHAVAREFYLIAFEAQRALEDLRDLLVVFDDEHTDGTASGFHSCDVRAHRGVATRPSGLV